MRILLSVIATVALVFSACSSNNHQVKQTPQKVEKVKKAPWETGSPQDKQMYVDTLQCPEATKVVRNALKWQITADNSNQLDEKGRYVIARTGPSGELGMFLYQSGPKPVLLMVVMMIGEQQVMLVDYYVLKYILDAQAVGGQPDVDVALGKATGEYFCVIPQ